MFMIYMYILILRVISTEIVLLLPVLKYKYSCGCTIHVLLYSHMCVPLGKGEQMEALEDNLQCSLSSAWTGNLHTL